MHIVSGKQTALLKDLNNVLYGKENFLLEKVRFIVNYSTLEAHYQRKSPPSNHLTSPSYREVVGSDGFANQPPQWLQTVANVGSLSKYT